MRAILPCGPQCSSTVRIRLVYLLLLKFIREKSSASCILRHGRLKTTAFGLAVFPSSDVTLTLKIPSQTLQNHAFRSTNKSLPQTCFLEILNVSSISASNTNRFGRTDSTALHGTDHTTLDICLETSRSLYLSAGSSLTLYQLNTSQNVSRKEERGRENV